jgi:hypothetical protein
MNGSPKIIQPKSPNCEIKPIKMTMVSCVDNLSFQNSCQNRFIKVFGWYTPCLESCKTAGQGPEPTWLAPGSKNDNQTYCLHSCLCLLVSSFRSNKIFSFLIYSHIYMSNDLISYYTSLAFGVPWTCIFLINLSIYYILTSQKPVILTWDSQVRIGVSFLTPETAFFTDSV